MTTSKIISVDTVTATNTPPTFHLLTKPSGSTCNLDCTYCFFLSKELLYPGDRFRMADDMLETYLRQLLESHRTPEVTVAWQGGEPTLMIVSPYDNFADMKPPEQSFYEFMVEKTGMDEAEVANMFQTFGSAFASEDYTIWRSRPDLSVDSGD